MSIEEAIIRRARPQLVAARMARLIESEVTKGCSPELHECPTPLEPPFVPLWTARERRIAALDDSTAAAVPFPQEWTTRRVWISPEQKCDWGRTELFIKQLAGLSERAWFQIAGNRCGIEVSFSCHQADLPVLWAAFKGEFEHCELTAAESTPLRRSGEIAWGNLQFRDYFPPPPYSHLLTSCDELQRTPLEPLLVVMMNLRKSMVGFYQCVFQPVAPYHNWHANVEILLDWEFALKLQAGLHPSHRYPQQAPSGDLHLMSREVETKAHNDKPFFCTAVRIGVFGSADRDAAALRALSASMSLFQHGGRPLMHLGNPDYGRVLSGGAAREMFLRGMTYRHGFLVNSHELAGLVHLFQTDILTDRQLAFEKLEGLPMQTRELTQGTRIGISTYANRKIPVCIPPPIRTLSTHVVSATGMGKSTVLENMLLQDIEEGKGAMFIDAHGHSVKRLLRLIPDRLTDRCIYFKPGAPDWVPLWNPLAVPPGGSIYTLADDIVSAMKRVVTGWGDRLEHVLRNGLIGLCCLGDACLLDLHNLCRQKSAESEALRKRIIETTGDEPVRLFWDADFLKNYRISELQAPMHKLSKLVSGGPASRMLSQPLSRISIRDAMDTGKILLVDLSGMGTELQETLGSFMMGLLLVAAVSRGDDASICPRPFALFVDEAHLFVAADAIESIIAQARKFGVQGCYAHQYLRQFGTGRIDALSTVGTTIVGRLDRHDAQYFTKDMQDLVEAKDIIALRPHEMIARIGTDVVKFRTEKPRKPDPGSDGRGIIEHTHQHYCVRASELARVVRAHRRHNTRDFSPLNDAPDQGTDPDTGFAYDEL